MGRGRRDRRSCRPENPAGRLARRRLDRNGRLAQRAGDRRNITGLRRERLWSRGRHRLDHHRRLSLRSFERRGPRLGRCDEPADPLRRGPYEPRVLCDDALGRRRGDDARRARGRRRADSPSGVGGQGFPRGDRRGHAGRQSDHAPSGARARSDRARKRALCAGDRRSPGGQGPRPRPRDRARRHMSMPCPASPAMSARTRRASCWPRRPILATNCG